MPNSMLLRDKGSISGSTANCGATNLESRQIRVLHRQAKTLARPASYIYTVGRDFVARPQSTLNYERLLLVAAGQDLSPTAERKICAIAQASGKIPSKQIWLEGACRRNFCAHRNDVLTLRKS
ncbi:hypothetical protein MRX96_002862 [Rhipicephalus microplus]